MKTASSSMEGGQPGPRIFISYRRRDCQPQANGLNYGLRHRLRGATVFMDLDSIPPGADFEHHIRAEIESCDIVLALIGDSWLDKIDGTSMRRLDQPRDFVRIEIESALQRGVRLIPVLVEGATMPAADVLPESIRGLARKQALELSDHRFSGDMERLATYIESLGQSQPEAESRMAPSKHSVRPLSRVEIADAEATLPKRVTRRWLLDTVDGLSGRELAALAEALGRCRGWTEDEIADDVYLNVSSAEPMIEALRLQGWPDDEISQMVSFLDAGDAALEEPPVAQQPPSALAIPARVTTSWLRRSVPSMDRSQLNELVEVLRRRKWSEGWLIDYVYLHASADVRPSGRPLPGDASKATLVPPKRVTDAWLRDHVPQLNQHDLSALVEELIRRRWTDGQIEDLVFNYVR